MFKEKERFLENKLWHKGDVYKLKQFYRNQQDSLQESKTKQFYALTDDVDRVIHNGVATNITETIVDLIGVDSATFIINGQEDKMSNVIDDAYIEHNLLDKLEKAITYLTWGKEAYAKYSVIDGQVSVSIVNTLNARTIKVNGKVIGYEFIIEENEENTERTIERYGKGYISTIYQEYDSKQDIWVDIKKSTLVFATDEILATHVEIPRDAYTQSVTMFDAIDETESRMVDEARKGKMVRLIDEGLIATDENGNKLKQDTTALQDFIKLKGLKSEDGKPLIEFHMADIDPEKRYIKSKKENIKTVVANAGLSYHTYEGGDVKSGISAESQRELEKTSIRTRKRYIHRLKPFMAKVMSLILFLERTLTDPIKLTEENSQDEIALIENNWDVSVTFEDYIQNSLDARVKIWGSQEAQSNFPIEYRIEKTLEGEVSEEEVNELVSKVQNEQGIIPTTLEPGEED